MEIVLTNRGSILLVSIDGRQDSYNKRDLSTTFNDPYLELTYKNKRLFQIDDHNDIVSPDSTSMEDLLDKVIELTSTGGTSSGGGGTPTDPEEYPLG